MGLIKDFRDFAMKGNVVDLAVGVIIGAAFGKIVASLVEDIVMPPIGKLIGGLDFSNLYVSLSDKVDAKNAELTAEVAKTAAAQPTTDALSGSIAVMSDVFSTAGRLPLVEAKKLGPVIAWGNFVTISINFLIVAFCIFMVIKMMAAAKRRFEREQAAEAAAPAIPPADVQLLTEIRDLLKAKG